MTLFSFAQSTPTVTPTVGGIGVGVSRGAVAVIVGETSLTEGTVLVGEIFPVRSADWQPD